VNNYIGDIILMIKLVLTDCDGVLTDGGMYYDNNGNEFKKFNAKDGMGFSLLKDNNILVGIITGEENNIILNRANKLNVDYLIMGSKNKLEDVKKLNIDFKNIAYIGDDINDYDLLNSVRLKACPNDANDNIKQIKNIFVLKNNGGNAAFREFVDLILN